MSIFVFFFKRQMLFPPGGMYLLPVVLQDPLDCGSVQHFDNASLEIYLHDTGDVTLGFPPQRTIN